MQLVRETLNETYESYKILTKVVKDIINKAPVVNRIYNIQDLVDIKKYPTLKSFFDNKLSFELTDWSYVDGPHGEFIPNFITSRDNDKQIYNNTIGFIRIYGSENYNLQTILHELNHAYDYFISKGKINNEKNRYRDPGAYKYKNKELQNIAIKYYEYFPEEGIKKFKFDNFEDTAKRIKKYFQNNNLPLDEIDDFIKIAWNDYSKLTRAETKYLRLHPEQSSFFVDAISQIMFFNNNQIRNFNEIYKEFKEKYAIGRWNQLTPKIQKDLLRKLSQYWHKIKDEHESKTS